MTTPSPDIAGLVEEARAIFHAGSHSMALDMLADAITQLQAERDEALTFVLNARRDQETAEAKVAGLVKALERLLNEVSKVDHWWGDLQEAVDFADTALQSAQTASCINHPDRPVRENLDGDDLCQECCDAWVRSEGQWAADEDAQTDQP